MIPLPRPGRLLSDFAADVAVAMQSKGLYRQDGEPVVLQPGDARMIPFAASMARTFFERFVIPTKRMSVGKAEDGKPLFEEVPESMTKATAEGVVSSVDFVAGLRPLGRIMPVSMPTFSESGKLILLPEGYHPRTEVLVLAGLEYETWPLQVAVDFLRELLREFPLAKDDGRSLSVQVAAMLTRFAILLLPPEAQVPFFIWNANSQRVGKTLLAKLVEIPVAGHAALRTLAGEEEEVAKILDSEVLAGSPSIIFDNVTGKIESAALDQFATSAVHAGRRMGGNKTFRIPKQTMVMLTANMATTSTDVAFRSLFVDLFSDEADPQRRVIEKPIGDSWLMRPENRFRILSALWSIVHAWDAAGRPEGKSRLVGFEDWSLVFGGIVEFAGFGDPLRKPEGEFGDHEQREMFDLVRVMAEGAFQETAIAWPVRDGVTFSNLITICRDHGIFDEEIQGREDRETKEFTIFGSSKSKMSRVFARYNGRTFHLGGELGSVKLERVQTTKGRDGRLWRIR